MQIQVSGHHIVVTDALRDYVVAKLEKMERHFEGLYEVSVVLSVQKLVHRAEATVTAARQKVLHAEAVGADLYASIDTLADKIDAQVRKHKEKLTDHHKGAASRARQSA